MRKKNPEYYSMIEDYIDKYREETGASPSIRDISAGTGLSKTTVATYLDKMKEDGRIEMVGHRNILTRKARMESEGIVSMTF